MNVRCPQCQTVFRVDPEKVPIGGVRARCARCSATFALSRSGVAATPRPETTAGNEASLRPATAAGAANPAVSAALGRTASASAEGVNSTSGVTPAGSVPEAPAATAHMPPTQAPASAAAQSPTPATAQAPAPASAPSPTPASAQAPAPASAKAPAPALGMRSGGLPSSPAFQPAAQAPAAPARPVGGAPKRASFAKLDPNVRAQRLARALVSDIVAYNKEKRESALASGKLKTEFREEIRKSWEEYVAQVGLDLARGTPFFRDSLNEILAKGQPLF